MLSFEPLFSLVSSNGKANADALFTDRPDLEIVYDKLTRLSRRQPAKAVFEYFSSLDEDAYVADVDSVERRLSFLDKPRGPIIEFFRHLAGLKWGYFKIGRKNHKSRFESPYSLKLIALLAQDTLDHDGDGLPPEHTRTNANGSPDGDEVSDGEDARSMHGEAITDLSHSFRLRPDYLVNIVLPADFTGTEASRLAEFVKSLPFS